MPDVEAHITGTVWKVECEVGQQAGRDHRVDEDGDARGGEDDGKVKEIRCSEGQSVSEGDTLVVLE